MHVTGPFGRLPLTDMQLTAVLNNLLDNAIEAPAAYRETGKKAPCLRIAVRQDALLRIFASDRLFFLSSASSAQKTDGDADGKPHGRRTDPAQTECGEREQTADALQNGR